MNIYLFIFMLLLSFTVSYAKSENTVSADELYQKSNLWNRAYGYNEKELYLLKGSYIIQNYNANELPFKIDTNIIYISDNKEDVTSAFLFRNAGVYNLTYTNSPLYHVHFSYPDNDAGRGYDLLMLRCAELTLQKGHRHFEIFHNQHYYRGIRGSTLIIGFHKDNVVTKNKIYNAKEVREIVCKRVNVSGVCNE